MNGHDFAVCGWCGSDEVEKISERTVREVKPAVTYKRRKQWLAGSDMEDSGCIATYRCLECGHTYQRRVW